MAGDEILCIYFILNITIHGFQKIFTCAAKYCDIYSHYQGISNSIVALCVAKYLTLAPVGEFKVHTHFTC